MGDPVSRMINPTNIPESIIVIMSINCSHNHERARQLTCEDGKDRLMDRLDLPLLKDIACEQSKDQQHDENEQCPGAEKLPLARVGNLCLIWDHIRRRSMALIRSDITHPKDNERQRAGIPRTIIRVQISICCPA
jgi:hypothetical protein